jgi:trigger factor
MQITTNNVDSLNAKLTLKLEPADYQPQFDAALKNYSKKVNLKGFRPGTAPMGMIKKMYGKSILAEEINKVINDSIYGYLKDNHIEILGNPLPSEDGSLDKADFDHPAEMEFHFDLGLAPQFNMDLSKIELPYYQVKVDQKMVDQQIEDLRRRHGNLENVEVSGDKDMLLVAFNELKENGEIKEGGIFHSSTVAIEYITDEETKKQLTGLKKGDKLVVDPHKLSHNKSDLAAMLGIDAAAAEGLTSKFQITVNEIRRMNMAPVDQELFDKVYGPGTVTNEEEFRSRISEELGRNFEGDSKNFFHRESRVSLINGLHIDLPEAFLKRWIIATSKNPISMHDLEHEFDHYADDLKWQLIENRIIKDNDVKIEREDVVRYTKENLAELYARYNLPALDDASLTQHAENILSKKEEVQNAVQRATTKKVVEVVREKANVKTQEVSFDELMEHYKELQTREHAHHAHAHAH